MDQDAAQPPGASPILLQLPANALHDIVLLLRDPAGLAATCRTAAALLDQDALLLDWADTWLARLAGSSALSERRDPKYAFLQWRRLWYMSTERLALLLLEFSTQRHKRDNLDFLRRHPKVIKLLDSRPRQLLEAGDALGAVKALLPSPQFLLLPYAAQAGNVRLLRELLADSTLQHAVSTHSHGDPDNAHGSSNGSAPRTCNIMASAAAAAARTGHTEALCLLLESLISSGQHSDAALADAHALVLEAAVWEGSRSAACVAAVLDSCRAHKPSMARLQQRDTMELLCVAARMGDAGVVGQLLDVGLIKFQHEAYEMALEYGQLHLLPLLRPDSCCDDIAAACVAVVVYHATDIGDAVAGLQALLPPALLRLLSGTTSFPPMKGRQLAAQAVQRLLPHNLVAALQSIWEGFSDSAARPALAALVVEALPAAACCPCAEAMQWAVQQVLAASDSSAAEVAGAKEQAALNALRHGHAEVLAVLQEPATTAARISKGELWYMAHLEGQLLQAVRSGDGSRVRAALQQLDGRVDRLCASIEHAAADLDAAAAAAVASVLIEKVEPQHHARLFGGMGNSFTLGHNGALLPLISERCPEVLPKLFEWVWRPSEDTDHRGQLGAALWRVRHPQQRPDYLNEVLEESGVLGLGWGCVDPHGVVTQLLHQLAGTRRTLADSGGASGVRSGAETAYAGRPAGGEVLSRSLVHGFMERGVPDALHALLKYMEQWQPYVFED